LPRANARKAVIQQRRKTTKRRKLRTRSGKGHRNARWPRKNSGNGKKRGGGGWIMVAQGIAVAEDSKSLKEDDRRKRKGRLLQAKNNCERRRSHPFVKMKSKKPREPGSGSGISDSRSLPAARRGTEGKKEEVRKGFSPHGKRARSSGVSLKNSHTKVREALTVPKKEL